MFRQLASPIALLLSLNFLIAGTAHSEQHLPNTELLSRSGDLAEQMVAGIDKFLLRRLEVSIERRAEFWNRDFRDDHTYVQSVAENRVRLAKLLGHSLERAPTSEMHFNSVGGPPQPIARTTNFDVYEVSWKAIDDLDGAGLLLVPNNGPPLADIVAIPDADQRPEQVVGLIDGVNPESQFARRLAASRCRVLVPTLISRERQPRAAPGRAARTTLTQREYLYRPAFELGRHLIGYEVDKVRAGIDWLIHSRSGNRPVGVIGYGEGGLMALYASALDQRVDVTCVSGYFGDRQTIWQEPIDRNVFGLLRQFGDAEIASLIPPRGLVVEGACGPQLEIPGEGGAPASLRTQTRQQVQAEWQRMLALIAELPALQSAPEQPVLKFASRETFCSTETLGSFLHQLTAQSNVFNENQPVDILTDRLSFVERQEQQIEQIDTYTQKLLHQSPYVRAKFMEKLDTSSLESYEQSTQAYRDYFRDEVIGAFDIPRLPLAPRSRLAYDEANWSGYEIVLDVFPDVFAYGILCLPKGIRDGERRPVVVCQHGLEGRPQDVVTGDHRAYHDFAAVLAERGFITFAPQNIYIGKDRFRTLQRKANPLGKTLFSIMVPQHQQIVDWLQTLPYVDPERIAFYGLSYGGKSAMRIPPLVPDYCLSICSADFNDWVRKCASSQSRYSYVFTGEYEIFEWNLGGTFNYAEMAALIAPRPFMVERGHFDGVAPDEWVASEFGKVRHLYAAKLFLPERCEIEWFYGKYRGVHTINGQGTFQFLHKHLHWPPPQ